LKINDSDELIKYFLKAVNQVKWKESGKVLFSLPGRDNNEKISFL
jgi:hypothetical protein